MTARILVSGSRAWSNFDDMIRDALAKAVVDLSGDVVVAHGNAGGADRHADRAARLLGLRTEPHPARWRTEGKAAGPLRNQRMVDLGADLMLAFPRGESRGTRDAMARARAAGIPAEVYESGPAA